MALRVFSIPARGCVESAEELNLFLRSHRVVSVERQLIQEQAASYWTIIVEYCERGSQPVGQSTYTQARSNKPKIDYRETLSPEEFAIFARLRDLRKQLAAAEAIPVYTIFTNEQLAAMVRLSPQNKTDLKQVEGIGEGRIDKYGEQFLACLLQPSIDSSGTSTNLP